MSVDMIKAGRRRLAIVFLTLACGFPALSAAGENGAPFALERYQVLSERNIYLKDRTPQSAPVAARPILRDTPPPVYRVQATLAGIVQLGDRYTAFFEDTVTRRTTRVRAGDDFLQGRVETITLDHVTHNRNGQRISVGVGERLEIVSGTPFRAGTEETAAQPVVSSSPAPGPNSALLEQLRLRRQRELEGR